MRHARQGLTLVEILVALALFGLLSVGVFTAFRVGASAWVSTRERLNSDRRVATANQILRLAIEGAVAAEARPRPGRETGFRPMPFFWGEGREMRFVTNYTLRGGPRGGLRVAALRVDDTDDGVRLLWKEEPYLGPYGLGDWIVSVVPDGVRPRGRVVMRPVAEVGAVVIADQLEAVTFAYLQPAERLGDPGVWLPEWEDPTRFPAGVRINVRPLAEETARLRPTTMTALMPAQYLSGRGRR